MILLVVAVGCGLVAMLGVRQALNQKPTNTEETVSILSAISAIEPGDSPTDVNTKFVEVAVSACPEGAVTSMEEVAERALRVPVMPGDWILKGKLTEPGDKGAVANIPAGMAVATIPVDATTTHSGLMEPGNRIDLLLTYADNATGMTRQKTLTVLECVEVFAVDNHVYGTDKGGESNARNITLLVTPEQGKAVILAQRIGMLSTMLRPRSDARSKPQGEISEEFLTSSFLGSNAEAASVMDQRIMGNDVIEPAPDQEPVLIADAEPVPSIDDLISRELQGTQTPDPGGSEPIRVAEVPKNTWTMEIYQGETVRLETIDLPADPAAASGWSPWSLFKN